MKNMVDYWNELSSYGPEASVIDPNDKIGYKNRYISDLRNEAILSQLFGQLADNANILDFGCGSGVFSYELTKNGYNAVGLDISIKLLKYAIERQFNKSSRFVLYNGKELPFTSESFSACVSYVVLNYLVEDEDLLFVLKEIHRVLKKGALFIPIEQVKWRKTLSSDGMKLQRPKKEFILFLEKAGFHSIETKLVRRGHFPLIYLIRYGIISNKSFSPVAKIELLLGKVFPNAIFDYGDVRFICKK